MFRNHKDSYLNSDFNILVNDTLFAIKTLEIFLLCQAGRSNLLAKQNLTSLFFKARHASLIL
jgi:hypothetical protein